MTQDQCVQKLERRLGKEYVLSSPESLQKYGRDETEDFFFPPLCAVLPESKQQVQEIVRFCYEHKLPIVPRGGGTGLAGGALPVKGGVVVSLEKMSKILEVDEKNATCLVEAGVITQVLQETVEEEGWYYPPDPSSRGSCFIGGNVATNASGPVCLKYGSTRQYVLGVEAVVGNGELIKAGGKIRKSSTGLDLTGLFVGSEGILGIMTEILLKLVHPPGKAITFFVSFDDLKEGFAFMQKALKEIPAIAALEFMEKEAMEMAEAKKGAKFPDKGEGAFLIELHLKKDEAEERQLDVLSSLCEAYKAKEAVMAEGQNREKLWSLRRVTGEAVKKKAPYKEDDCVLPRGALLPFLQKIERVERETGLRAVCYGHVGDGNLHVNILKENVAEKEWVRKRDAFEEKLFHACAQLGGTISGEHGIGWVQRRHLRRLVPERNLQLMRQIKKFLDPEGLMNPEKVI